METILFCGYSIAFLLLLFKNRFFTNALPFKMLLFIFILKIAAGFIYLFIYTKYYNGGDTITLMNDVKLIYSSLHYSFKTFVHLITGIPGNQTADHIFNQLSVRNSGYEQLFNNSLFFRKNAGCVMPVIRRLL
jgi:hypothetical protein